MYIVHWNILPQICEENKEKIDNTIFQKFSNIGLKCSAEEFKNFKTNIDCSECFTGKSNAVEEWKKFENIFEDLELLIHQHQKFQHRYEQALTPYHFIAYMIAL